MLKLSIFETFLSGKQSTGKTVLALIISSIAVSMTLYYILTAYFGAPTGIVHRSIFVIYVLILTFFLHPLKRKSWGDINAYFYVDLALIFISFGIGAYILYDVNAWQMRWYNPTLMDTIVGSICIILVLEATRRTVGIGMVCITGFFIFHAVFSGYFPSLLRTPPTNWVKLIDVLFSDHGVFSLPIQAMASYIILFLTFSSLLLRSGAGKFFVDLAYSVAGRTTGGPAKTAVLASTGFGSLSGSSVANTVTTGSFTIPLMKSTGYNPVTAAAIEAVASTGGNYMPPIMGVVAFLIAQFMGIPYLQVCKHALIPALLYFFAIQMMVHFEAKRQGVKPLSKAELPSFKHTLLQGGHLLLTLVALIIFLVAGYTAMMAAFWGIVTVVVLSFIRKETRLTPVNFISGLEEAARAAIVVGIACACAGLIMGSLYASGLGMMATSSIVRAAGGMLWLTLIYTMILSLLLGMGMTSIGVYLTLLTVVIPALIKMGVAPIAAHMFCFYFGVISNITPPVCVAAFAGAAIAGAPPMKTGWKAFQLGIAAYIIPFLFIYNPSILMIGNVWTILLSTITCACGIIFLASGTVGWFFRKANILERTIMIIASLLLIRRGLPTDIAGFALMGIIATIQKFYKYPEEIDNIMLGLIKFQYFKKLFQKKKTSSNIE